ncbi:hypothetical protein BGZ60DRAFT_532298 [Tricladium varicosporioides]|nr:hypothetical protein BGZ60DRAFT_532298 [Hymenoscyphus varicosporioides]
MRFNLNLLALYLGFAGIHAQAVVDKCPKDEMACLDVINSSLCISQNATKTQNATTIAALIKCVEYEGGGSNITGAAKLCRCPGCHSAPINAAIAKMFPPPCA